MDINKVLKKQKKSYKRFMLSMGFIFIGLPIALICSKINNPFFYLYLLIIEVLILESMMIRTNEEVLEFKQIGSKVAIEVGVLHKKYTIIPNKIAIIHIIPTGKFFDILIISKSRFRNKRLKHVDFRFLSKQPIIDKYYNRIRKEDEDPYFYFVIKKGGIKKYMLLDYLYKTCVSAIFTDITIEKIKEYRSQE